MDKKIEKKGWSWQKWVLIAAAVAGLAFVGSNIYKDAGVSKLNVETNRLLVDTIHRGVFQEFIPITGVVEPIKTVFIDAVEGGRIEEIYVEDGAMLTKGQKIMQLSNPNLQLNYLNLEGQIMNQINQLENLKLNREQQSLNLREQALDVEYRIDLLGKRTVRNKSLYSDEVISKVEYEDTQDEYEHLLRRRKLLADVIKRDSLSQIVQENQLESSVDLMQRNLKISKQSLENLLVRAPLAGQLSGMDSEIGELITQGGRIAQMDDLSNFKVKGRIDEFYITRIFLNQEGSFVLGGKTYDLIIKKIYPDVRNGVFEVDMVFTSEIPKTIKRGQTLSIKLALSAETQALLIAKGGFYQTTGGNWVYMIDPKTNTAFKRDISVGRQNPSYYEVTEGLKEGDIVITSSYENFGDKDELVLN
jgi:HlyD family secretion protein